MKTLDLQYLDGRVETVSVKSTPYPAGPDKIAEGRNRDRMGCNYVLTSSDAEWLTFADRLAAYFHVKHVSPRHLNDDAWHAARDWLRDEGLRLKIGNVPWEVGL